MKNNNLKLFDDYDDLQTWKEHWQDMPEFIYDDLMPYQQIIISFECKEDVLTFSKLINQKLTYKTKSVWFPKKDNIKPSNYEYK